MAHFLPPWSWRDLSSTEHTSLRRHARTPGVGKRWVNGAQELSGDAEETLHDRVNGRQASQVGSRRRAPHVALAWPRRPMGTSTPLLRYRSVIYRCDQ